MDIGALLLWTFYNYLLVKLAASDNGLPGVPPAGHVPALVRRPLQLIRRENTKQNESWDTWLGFALPLVLLFWRKNGFDSSVSPFARDASFWRVAMGRPLLWWMATQVADDMLTSYDSPLQSIPSSTPIPLPIQYWIRLSSRVTRWALLTVAVVLTQWPTIVGSGGTITTTTTFSVFPYICGLLPVAQWIVASAQIFGFWIPIAAMQYMRAHFIAAEAESVTVQPTVGHHYSIQTSSMS
jgi:hypothetical protein